MAPCKVTPPDPVHQHEDGSWYFYDEVWTNEYGPYPSKEKCDAALSNYVTKFLETNHQVLENTAARTGGC